MGVKDKYFKESEEGKCNKDTHGRLKLNSNYNKNDGERLVTKLIIFFMRKVSFKAIIFITIAICYDEVLSGFLGSFAYFSDKNFHPSSEREHRLLVQPNFKFYDLNIHQYIFIIGMVSVGFFFPVFIWLR